MLTITSALVHVDSDVLGVLGPQFGSVQRQIHAVHCLVKHFICLFIAYTYTYIVASLSRTIYKMTSIYCMLKRKIFHTRTTVPSRVHCRHYTNYDMQ